MTYILFEKMGINARGISLKPLGGKVFIKGIPEYVNEKELKILEDKYKGRFKIMPDEEYKKKYLTKVPKKEKKIEVDEIDENPFDVNKDGKVDIKDVAEVAKEASKSKNK